MTDDSRRIGMNDEAEVEAHLARRVNDDPADELRREGDDDVDSHILRREPTDEARRENDDDDEVEGHVKKA